jgi:hypothetical protein
LKRTAEVPEDEEIVLNLWDAGLMIGVVFLPMLQLPFKTSWQRGKIYLFGIEHGVNDIIGGREESVWTPKPK